MITRDRIFRLAICWCVGAAISAPRLSYAQSLTAPQGGASDEAESQPAGPLSDNYQWDARGLAIAEPGDGSSAEPALAQPSPAVRGSGDTPSNAPGIED